MRRILGGIDTVSEYSGKVVSFAIIFIICVMLTEIMLRYVFNAPTIWAHETCQHVFGSYSVLAGACVLRSFQHIKVDIIHARFSPRQRAIADSVTYLLFFLFVGVLLVGGWQIAWKALKIREVSFSPWRPPIYPLKLTVPIGAFLMLLQGLAHFVRALSMAIRGKELV